MIIFFRDVLREKNDKTEETRKKKSKFIKTINKKNKIYSTVSLYYV